MKLSEIFNRDFKFIQSQELRFNIKTKIGVYNRLEDTTFLKKKFRDCMDNELNLSNPTTFNEKL